ncbi:MAG TPA: hypothetical protein DCZ23_01040 [Lachnospiraceae bacterium]|nr:hypothetical protein [Lachnospiraceae bacterium]
MKEIEFDIRLTTSELYAFSMRHAYSGLSGIAGLVISFGSLVICALDFKHMQTTSFIALIVIGLLFTVIQPVMLYGKARVQVKRNENINGSLHYKLSEKGIEISQGEQTASVKWHEVRKRKMAKNAIYLYMSPIRAFIFPKSQCNGYFDDAAALIKDMMDKYKNYEPEEDDSASETEGKED